MLNVVTNKGLFANLMRAAEITDEHVGLGSRGCRSPEPASAGAIGDGRMAIQAVIELVFRHGCVAFQPLLHHIYRSSAHGMIALVLNDISPDAIDQSLDTVVKKLPLTIPGLRYFVPLDDDLPTVIYEASLIFASTRSFRKWLVSLGVDESFVMPLHSLGARLPHRRSSFAISALQDREHALG